MGNAVRNGTTPGSDGHVLFFAALPECLADEQRRRKYDEPLASMIREAGIGSFLRGSSRGNDRGGIDRIELEAELARLPDFGRVLGWLMQLGAPPETLVEIHTLNSAQATVKFRLGEVIGEAGKEG